MRSITTKTVLSIAGVLTATAVLAACGSNDTAADHHAAPSTAAATAQSGATSGGAAATASPHNAADVMFASMMIPHHQQALEMTAMVPSRTQNPELVALAKQIDAAQGPEIAQMTGWLGQWGAEPGAMDHSAHGDGMMTAEQMDSLHKLTGPPFDKAWLEMMIAHHEGAVDMARTELAQGQNPEAKQLAQSIIDGQEAEISQMKQMLAS